MKGIACAGPGPVEWQPVVDPSAFVKPVEKQLGAPELGADLPWVKSWQIAQAVFWFWEFLCEDR